MFMMVLVAGGSVFAMNPYAHMQNCGPQCFYVTKMVPCVETKMVASVEQAEACVPQPYVEYRTQKVLVKECPIGCPPGGSNPCLTCYPSPSCKVVCRDVPCIRYCTKKVPYYRVCYKPVCRKVMRPQVFKVQTIPLCR